LIGWTAVRLSAAADWLACHAEEISPTIREFLTI